MAIANTAWIIASNGLRVLTVDWNLESPGLHRYFHPFLADKQLLSSRGVLDMIKEFRDGASARPGSTIDPDLIEARVLQYAVSLAWEFPRPGVIDFLPAGRMDGTYMQAMRLFDWDSFYEREGGALYLEALRRDMLEQYDYVLIDSPTGQSETAGICIADLPDIVVDCFTMSTQSIDGAVGVARYIQRQQRAEPITILPVPMRVDRTLSEQAAASREYAKIRFSPYLQHIASGRVGSYWEDVEVPYQSEYSYEEVLAPFRARNRPPDSVLAAYLRLSREITSGQVGAIDALDESVRRDWLAKFERPRLTTPSVVNVCHAAVDRMWSDWIRVELASVGVRAVPVELDSLGDSADTIDAVLSGNATRTLLLVSRGCLECPASTVVWTRALSGAADDSIGAVVSIRLDAVQLSEPFADRVTVELQDASEDQARTRLLAMLSPSPTVLTTRGVAVDPSRPRYPRLSPMAWKAPNRNPGFTGRRVLLNELRNALKHGNHTNLTCVLVGPNGFGKTQLALEFVHRFAADYDIVWWLTARDLNTVQAGMAYLATTLGVAPGDGANLTAAAYDMLKSGVPYPRWLVVLDDVQEPEHIVQFVPIGRNGHVLATSRHGGWVPPATVLRVGAFNREESLAFLRSRAPGLDEREAHLTAERVRDKPAELRRAIEWLEETNLPISVFLDTLAT